MPFRLTQFVALFTCALAAGANESSFSRQVKPLLQKYCHDCHADGMNKGNVTLDHWKSEAEALKDRERWARVISVLERHEMPPRKKKQPTPAERAELIVYLERHVLGNDCDRPDPGRVTIRRLNRVEYNNTVRELLGIDFQPAADFPVDDSGYGFDTIGDVLSIPPILLEKYLAAAEKIVDAALGLNQASVPETRRYPIDLLEVGYNAKQRGDGWVVLNSVEEDDVAVPVERATPAEYIVRAHAYARQESTNRITLAFMLDQQPIQVVEVETNQIAARVYESRITVPPGKHRLRAVVRRVKDGLSETEALRWKSGPLQQGSVFLEWMEIDGPHAIGDAQSLATIQPPGVEKGPAAAREFITGFARRAYRREVSEAETARLFTLAENSWSRGSSHEEGIAVAMKAAMVSPHFLFRRELQPEPDNPRSIHPINEFALAARLSYFIWSAMPDEELFREARNQTLRKNLETQVRRMLRDPRALALVENFGGQWLQFRAVTLLTPDHPTYQEFDEPLRDAMRRETELLFEHILREDRSIVEFLTADYTFVNDRLARHYGLDATPGPEFQRVSLAGTPRRGVLTHASVLALTSNPTRTSPVKRGKWVLENFLNAPPPPPPADVPELDDSKELKGTLRQRLEQHRDNPLCASCHARMDPIGFGLENFDGIGSWRVKDHGEPIDATGELTTGESFGTPIEMIQILATEKKDQYVRCVIEKMLTYALGRGVEYYDRCAVTQIADELSRNDHKFSALILGIARSAPFQLRRGDSN
jgi:hypothetical protein